MTLGVAEIDRWDPRAVLEVGRAATGRADAAASASAALAGLPAFSAWAGVAADTAREAIRRTRADLDAYAEAARSVTRATEQAAGAITKVKAELRRLRDAAQAAGTTIEHPSFTGRLEAILAEAETVDAQLAQSLRLTAGGLGAPRTPAPVPALSTAQEVKRWWDSLDRDEKNQLLACDPDRLGNLDGVATADRDLANRAAMARDIDRVAHAAAGRQVGDVAAHPERYGLTARDVRRYTNAVRTRTGIDAAVGRSGAPAFLLIYQPEAFLGQGRVAMAINNPDEAGHTAVVVPGTGQSVAGGWLARDEAANLYAEILRAAPAGPPPCVVAWMGYDAPNSPVDPRVGMTGLAQEGGALLARDVNALAVTRAGPAHVTVIGHSYGATTVADAAAGFGMRADDVVLIGCPGTDMARSAADFGLPAGGHVYVGSASTDPVTHLGRLPQVHIGESGFAVALGPDPAAEGFGSTRFKAEVPRLLSLADHDGYYDPGSESLFSMADIASGRGAALQSHGMTAPHRGSVLAEIVGALSPAAGEVLRDPELFRPTTGGHHHDTAGGPR